MAGWSGWGGKRCRKKHFIFCSRAEYKTVIFFNYPPALWFAAKIFCFEASRFYLFPPIVSDTALCNQLSFKKQLCRFPTVVFRPAWPRLTRLLGRIMRRSSSILTQELVNLFVLFCWWVMIAVVYTLYYGRISGYFAVFTFVYIPLCFFFLGSQTARKVETLFPFGSSL